ncbi:hypothetical protein GOP47_0004794 [Adiantum capillus-veneris]|uniref:Uncharacterized protein n=1 Tax=Adiantum capillus-veneris TaxID=13818 RepID=A0A9D4ZNJ2_ADICA|nr:hypothetical protein GOP47_0004794 [Adiantum capillus-veneris]
MAKSIDNYKSWFEAAGEHKVREENVELREWNAELEMKMESICKQLMEQQTSIQRGAQAANVQELHESSMETVAKGSLLVVDVDVEPMAVQLPMVEDAIVEVEQKQGLNAENQSG